MNATLARLVVALVAAFLASGCATTATGSPSPSASSAAPSATASSPPIGGLVIVGRIVTMDEPPIAEALLIEDGTVVAVGTRDEVIARAGDGVPVIELGDNVAYPGFIDAHAHWIGDSNYYHLSSPAEGMDRAVERGWTSISEQWINPEKLGWLTGFAKDDAMPIRVDAYLALNFDKEFFGDWYVDEVRGPVDDHLRIQGLKIHLDDGNGDVLNWGPADVTATIVRANDAGWQVSVHAMSTEAMEIVLDAFEAAIGPSGPNPLHHRIEHAMQVTDAQLARLVAMDIGVVTQTDGVADWMSFDEVLPRFDRGSTGAALDAVARWRDLVDAGLHFATSTDAPWTFPDAGLTDDMGRPVDLIAAAMDGRRRVTPATPSWLLDQPLTAEQGLRAVTIEAAWALGDEARRGHLAPGTLGDVTILSGDIATATPDEIRAMRVVATIVGGIPVFCADPATCSHIGG